MINRNILVDWLRALGSVVDNDVLPVIRVPNGSPDFAWRTLTQCNDCGYPGIDVGQDGDCRYSTDGEEGLHAQVFTKLGVIDFHLDEVDVCRNPAGHAVEDTHIAAGALIGAALGILAGALIAGEKGALIGALAVGGSGALVGVNTPKRKRRVFLLSQLLDDVA